MIHDHQCLNPIFFHNLHKILDVGECIDLMRKDFTIVVRPNLDISKDGIFVERHLPFIHIHLGHGAKIGREFAISIDESGSSVYF